MKLNNKIRALTLILFLVIISCGCSPFQTPMPPHIQFSDKIQSSYINRVKKKYNLSVIGSGGAMLYKIEEIIVFFNAYRSITLEEGRKLYIDLVDELVDEFNSHDYPEHYVYNPPFSYANTRIDLGFYDPNEPKKNLLTIGFSLNDGKIVYDYCDSTTGRYVEIHRETYEEAKAILKEQESLDEAKQ